MVINEHIQHTMTEVGSKMQENVFIKEFQQPEQQQSSPKKPKGKKKHRQQNNLNNNDDPTQLFASSSSSKNAAAATADNFDLMNAIEREMNKQQQKQLSEFNEFDEDTYRNDDDDNELQRRPSNVDRDAMMLRKHSSRKKRGDELMSQTMQQPTLNKSFRTGTTNKYLEQLASSRSKVNDEDDSVAAAEPKYETIVLTDNNNNSSSRAKKKQHKAKKETSGHNVNSNSMHNKVNEYQHSKVVNNFNDDDDTSSYSSIEEVAAESSHHSPSHRSRSHEPHKVLRQLFHNQQQHQQEPVPIVPFQSSTDGATSGETSGATAAQQQQPATNVDLSIFDLLQENSKKFILKPAPMGLTIKMQIFRQKKSMSSAEYKCYLENLDGQLLPIMTARKRKKTSTHCYKINSITFNLETNEDYLETPCAKLKANLLGTHFTLYDFGFKPEQLALQQQSNIPPESPEEDDHDSSSQNEHQRRKEYLSIAYEMNLLGIKGPREMCIILPGMHDNMTREDFVVRRKEDSIASAWKRLEAAEKLQQKQQLASTTSSSASSTLPQNTSKKFSLRKSLSNMMIQHPSSSSADATIPSPTAAVVAAATTAASTSAIANSSSDSSSSVNLVRLKNKQPVWHPEVRSYALNFGGRVTQASVKNYQIVHHSSGNYVITQFGKIEQDQYTCDYSYPMCALQAFAVALSSLDNKIGCD